MPGIMKLRGASLAGAMAALWTLGGVTAVPLAAQTRWTTVSGEAVVLALTANGLTQRAVAVTTGGVDDVQRTEETGASLTGARVGAASAVSAGSADDSDIANIQSIATASDLDLLDGLITAGRVIAIANTFAMGNTVTTDGEGSVFTDLVVAGESFGPGDAVVPANTRRDLPGVGYVILNEQVDARGSTRGVTVNMIRVVLTDARGKQTGEIVVGSATSTVSRG